jgi:hypothetical protein
MWLYRFLGMFMDIISDGREGRSKERDYAEENTIDSFKLSDPFVIYLRLWYAFENNNTIY